MDTYNHLNAYYKKKFGKRTLKICVDGFFTCPNRDGSKSTGGCIYCSSRGSGELIKENLTIKEQVQSFLNSYRGARADSFIVFFQNFTNTYDTVENLKKKYDEALCDERITGLDIATRADCINEDVAQLLASYKDRYYVCAELGLQTSNEKTHDYINQKITNKDVINAITLLNKYHIDIILHIMVGLPGETHEDLVNTVKFLNTLNYNGLKIHSTYIVENTILNEFYKKGLYKPIDEQNYIDEVIYVLTHISPDVIIHRINSDPPKNILVAPEWSLHKKRVMNRIENMMKEHSLYQGMYYKEEL